MAIAVIPLFLRYYNCDKDTKQVLIVHWPSTFGIIEWIQTLKPQFLRNKLTPRESSNSCVFFWMAETLIPWPSPVSTR